MKWTKEEEQKVIDLLKIGETYENISIKLNRTKKSIKEKANRLGYKYSMYNEVEYIDKICPICNNFFKISKNDKQKMSQVFCSHSCSATNNNTGRKKNKIIKCINCSKEIISKHKSQKYCNHNCQWEYTYMEYIKRWKEGKEDGLSGEYNTSRHIRRYLYEKYNSSCSRCGWTEVNKYTGKIPLELEHIDGDHKNNKEENLDLICPNCHSLTETYKGANKGKGRKERKRHWENRDIFYGKKIKERKYCNCGKEINSKSKECIECNYISSRKVKNRPDKETLLKNINDLGYVGTGRKYGVSDNTIRKWVNKNL